jgi:hypothetical protein
VAQVEMVDQAFQEVAQELLALNQIQSTSLRPLHIKLMELSSTPTISMVALAE